MSHTPTGAGDGAALVGQFPVPARTAVKTVVRAAGTVTQRWRPGPDFIVIGCKRGGTTTLHQALLAHPGVAPLVPRIQRIKSPHYFDLRHDRGIAWYRSHFPLHVGGGNRPRRLVGEADPYLLYHPLAPPRVAAEAGRARLVAMLRDPVERAFSHHWDRVKNGVEALPFLDAVAAEAERLAGEEEHLLAHPDTPRPRHEHFSYLDRGLYDRQLRRWLAHVPAERLLVVRSEDFYAYPGYVFAEVCGFLGLPDRTPEKFGRHHAHPDRPRVDPQLRARLWPHFEESALALADLLGTPRWWDAAGPTELAEAQVLLAGAAA